MQQAGRDENGGEQAPTIAEGSEQAAVSTQETQQRRKKVVGCLLQVYALQLTLFGLLAWFVHVHPILPLDVAIKGKESVKVISDQGRVLNVLKYY